MIPYNEEDKANRNETFILERNSKSTSMSNLKLS